MTETTVMQIWNQLRIKPVCNMLSTYRHLNICETKVGVQQNSCYKGSRCEELPNHMKGSFFSLVSYSAPQLCDSSVSQRNHGFPWNRYNSFCYGAIEVWFQRNVSSAIWQKHMFSFNTFRPRQNGRHFANDIFKWIFLNENIWIWINMSLKYDPDGQVEKIPSLV